MNLRFPNSTNFSSADVQIGRLVRVEKYLCPERSVRQHPELYAELV